MFNFIFFLTLKHKTNTLNNVIQLRHVDIIVYVIIVYKYSAIIQIYPNLNYVVTLYPVPFIIIYVSNK